jgi:hypothetical protein
MTDAQPVPGAVKRVPMGSPRGQATTVVQPWGGVRRMTPGAPAAVAVTSPSRHGVGRDWPGFGLGWGGV